MQNQEFLFWNLSLDSVQSQVNAGSEGLTSKEARRRIERFGLNSLRARRKRALVLQFLARFGNPLVIVLLAASAISALTGDVASFLIIGVIVLISVTLDFVQEYQAGQAAERLRQS